MPTQRKPQRLALFLDGTWNTEDDSTNVRHAYQLTKEEEMPDGFIQKRYYDRGVGTGMFLDSFIGGGLGYGLETNVREAYGWLMDHYSEGDEVYIFGFSRGAYTARSLVGFIAACGLVRRGSPLTVNQLWGGYGFISQNRNERRNSWWKRALKKRPNCFRRIIHIPKVGSKKETFSEAEKLVREWSRRIDITYLGIFDTVGALGINALGIPGISGHLSESHNQQPTRIIKHCRHALAINENRASFRLTPMLNYVRHWPNEYYASYENVITQRWFAGAHSNIGGGYANNTYSVRPLLWILEGAQEAKLALMPLPEVSDEAKVPPFDKSVDDSYTSFVGILWPHVLREKRHHRPIGRAPEVRAHYSLIAIHEEVDDSVFNLLETKEDYNPPNLLSYIRRGEDEERKQLVEGREASQKWPGDRWAKKRSSQFWSRLYLALWASTAALGLYYMLEFFWIDDLPIPAISISVLAALYVLVDWGEARTTLSLVLSPEAVILKVIWNVVFWMRLFGVLAFVVGLTAIVGGLISMVLYNEISMDWLQQIFDEFWAFTKVYLLYPILVAGGTIALLDVLKPFSFFKIKEDSADAYTNCDFEFRRKEKEEKKKKEEEEEEPIRLKSIEIFALIYTLVFFAFQWFGSTKALDPEAAEVLSGKFLLLHLLLAAFGGIFIWMKKPMDESRTNLGSMLDLQLKFKGQQVADLFNQWGHKMLRGWVKKPADIKFKDENEKERNAWAWFRTRQVVRFALWRDLLGFIPIYFIVFSLTFYIGDTMKWWPWNYFPAANLPGDTSWWLYFVLGIALLDIIENSIHLNFLKKHSTTGSSNLQVGKDAVITWLKNIGFIIALFITFVTFILIATELIKVEGDGLRWSIALLLIYAEVFALLYLLYLLVKRVVKSLMPEAF